jgi:hypothetical protein
VRIKACAVLTGLFEGVDAGECSGTGERGRDGMRVGACSPEIVDGIDVTKEVGMVLFGKQVLGTGAAKGRKRADCGAHLNVIKSPWVFETLSFQQQTFEMRTLRLMSVSRG